MKMSHERGKAVQVYNDNVGLFHDYYRTSSDVRCKEHPQQQSPVGVCAYCLEERLLDLVCSDCGVHRRSTCSCSEIASGRRSSCGGGGGGRVSFLIENEQKEQVSNPSKSEEMFLIKRSKSSCVEMKKKNGFWRIGRLFKKKREEEDGNTCGKSEGGAAGRGVDEKSDDFWIVDYTGVSRSRSLCSFRGGGIFGSEDGTDSMNFSGARSSGFNAGDAGFNGANRRVFSLKESNFTGGDDGSGFIDFHAESKEGSPGRSCLLIMDESGNRKNRRSFKGWRWMFKTPEK
ncbi:hypothetical protein like AT3G25590 [Hibiscus trionum]|uniref:Uncharacterized protein n=1 Tax=Hibiscus trionum TaxID=183268 RepID=A0A9W7MFH0_HIBTR|nr:hypothetical protein like AT3G25590 [Hibiscus trionum]